MFKKLVMTTFFVCGCGKKNSGGGSGGGGVVPGGAPKKSPRAGGESPLSTNQLLGRTGATPSNLSVLRISDQNDSSGRPGEAQLPAHGRPVLHSPPSKRQRSPIPAEKDGLLTGSPARTAGQKSRRDLRPLSISQGRPPVGPPLPTVRTPEVHSSPREVKRSSPSGGLDYLPDWPLEKRSGPPSGFTPFFFPRTGDEAPSHLLVSDQERAANERKALEEQKRQQEKERKEAEAGERANLTRRRAVEAAAKEKKADELRKKEKEEARQKILRAQLIADDERRKKQLEANAAAEEANRLKERQQTEAKRSFRIPEKRKPLLAEPREAEIEKSTRRHEEEMAKAISDYKANMQKMVEHGLDTKPNEAVLKLMEGAYADMKAERAKLLRNPNRMRENAVVNRAAQRPNVVHKQQVAVAERKAVNAGINPAGVSAVLQPLLVGETDDDHLLHPFADSTVPHARLLTTTMTADIVPESMCMTHEAISMAVVQGQSSLSRYWIPRCTDPFVDTLPTDAPPLLDHQPEEDALVNAAAPPPLPAVESLFFIPHAPAHGRDSPVKKLHSHTAAAGVGISVTERDSTATTAATPTVGHHAAATTGNFANDTTLLIREEREAICVAAATQVDTFALRLAERENRLLHATNHMGRAKSAESSVSRL